MKTSKPKLTIVKDQLAASPNMAEIKNLNRIKGQVEAISQMLQSGRRIDDVLTQLSAARAALKSIESRILQTHIQNTLDSIASGEQSSKAIDGLMSMFDKRQS